MAGRLLRPEPRAQAGCFAAFRRVPGSGRREGWEGARSGCPATGSESHRPPRASALEAAGPEAAGRPLWAEDVDLPACSSRAPRGRDLCRWPDGVTAVGCVIVLVRTLRSILTAVLLRVASWWRAPRPDAPAPLGPPMLLISDSPPASPAPAPSSSAQEVFAERAPRQASCRTRRTERGSGGEVALRSDPQRGAPRTGRPGRAPRKRLLGRGPSLSSSSRRSPGPKRRSHPLLPIETQLGCSSSAHFSTRLPPSPALHGRTNPGAPETPSVPPFA